ncbi:lipid kinase YegS [Marinobacter alexandrii]|uniref:lipid kinase YegS n=1 Tax=Marinobacter alexandrii TaxID=2570351 RepID=UPI003299EFC9
MKTRLIVNGKSAGDSQLRASIASVRESGTALEVRSTFESGDVQRMVDEAIGESVDRLLIGGGDGSVNEVADALLQHPREQRPPLGIVPLGTANDFAAACGIPTQLDAALELACHGSAIAIDALTANDRIVANVATAGFGAQVTAQTPSELKAFLGGGAYTLMGIIKALNFKPYQGKIVTADEEIQGSAIVAAVCNGRQAGGGQPLAPDALLTDGLMDVLLILAFPPTEIDTVIKEAMSPTLDGRYVRRFRTHFLEVHSDDGMPCNLDGEPYEADAIRFDVVAKALDVVLPPDCPCI